MSGTAGAALERAAELVDRPWRPRAPSGRRFGRALAMGDPQAPLATVLAILDRHDALGPDGMLRDDTALLSIGDHFDFGLDAASAARDGLRLLRWLAEHPPDQAVLIASNHDLSRVMELIAATDDGFAAAREAGRAFRAASEDERPRLRADFLRRFPFVPTPLLAARDYSGFSEAQRALVQDLLLAGRYRLAAAAPLRLDDGGWTDAPVLFVHAGITMRELRLLGSPGERDARALARRLDRFLLDAVERVRPAWSRRQAEPLDLRPLHVAGGAGRDGGGLLYHRPADPSDPRDASWRWDPAAPRRFDPRSLPVGLAQAAGHAGHRKALEELAAWVAPSARALERGGVRTLRSDGRCVAYEAGLVRAGAGEAVLHMFDGEMAHVPPHTYRLIEIGAP